VDTDFGLVADFGLVNSARGLFLASLAARIFSCITLPFSTTPQTSARSRSSLDVGDLVSSPSESTRATGELQEDKISPKIIIQAQETLPHRSSSASSIAVPTRRDNFSGTLFLRRQGLFPIGSAFMQFVPQGRARFDRAKNLLLLVSFVTFPFVNLFAWREGRCSFLSRTAGNLSHCNCGCPFVRSVFCIPLVKLGAFATAPKQIVQRCGSGQRIHLGIWKD
jgi:hypothetical protein